MLVFIMVDMIEELITKEKVSEKELKKAQDEAKYDPEVLK